MVNTINIGTTGNSQQERCYQFQAQLDQWEQQLDDRLAEAYRNIIFLVFMNIVVGGLYSPGTPVDTGFARNSWVVGIGGIGTFAQPPSDTSANTKQKPSYALVAVDAGNAIILDVKPEDEVHLTSNCVYMAALEDGHSGQAPTGMVWLAIHAAQQIADEVVREMLS